ncbi:MAG: TlpA family protein disulfide reductase [Acidimicrobiia bacterium]|nr:TlpA family protein disulfide reductase [Acidimicrobiia bacterium]MYG93313.1 TlpA family protein disulfide reductase [Acidimicrobiia bacterium]
MAAKINKKVIILGVVAAVVVAGLVAFFTVAGAEPEAAEITVVGDPVPVLAADAVPLGQDIAFGWDAPKVTGSDWKGNPVTIDPADGRAKLIVFLAHWCPHCQVEVPKIQAWLNETGGHPEVDMYGVATSNDRTRTNWPPGEWLEREGWTPPTVMDKNGKVARSFGMRGTPFWAAVNSEGKVVYRAAGGVEVEGLLGFHELATQSMAELQDFIGQTGG